MRENRGKWDINPRGTRQRENEAPEQGYRVQQELSRHEKKRQDFFFGDKSQERWLYIDKRGHETGQGEEQGTEEGGMLPVPAQGDSLLIGPVRH